MKKFVLVIVFFGILIGPVQASSINGDFNGNPIVKVKSNGNVLPTEDIPAIIYEGRTLVPIYMLRNLGANVQWNQSDYSVNVSIPVKDDNPTHDEKKDNQIKDYAKTADLYKKLQDTSAKTKEYGNTLSLSFHAKNNGGTSPITDSQLQNKFYEIKSLADESIKTIENSMLTINGIDMSDLKKAMQLIKNSIEYYDLAKNYFITWEQQPNNSDQNSSTIILYLSNEKAGLTMALDAENLSAKGYMENINKIINY
jgi:hypothetical protein